MAGNDALALRGVSRLTLAVSEHYIVTDDPDVGWQVHSAYFYAIGLHDTTAGAACRDCERRVRRVGGAGRCPSRWSAKRRGSRLR